MKRKKRRKFGDPLKKESIHEEAQPLKAQQERRKEQRRRISNLLQEAERLVYAIRNRDYKHPMQNFTNIANLWNTYICATGRDSILITPVDIAALNVLQKIARISCNQNHMDSWLDIAGYAACAERIIKNQ